VAQPVGNEYLSLFEPSNVTILVVEDSPTQALLLEGTLEQAGYHVAVAANGEEAIAYLREAEPTLILSDVIMPQMDGYELCRHVKDDKRLQNIPVILITSLSDPVDILRGLQSGADNFITKPYQESELLSRMQYILANQELRRRSAAGLGVEIFFAGRKHFLTAERLQIIDLLLSSFETAVTHKIRLEEANTVLKELNERLVNQIAERKKAEREKEKLIGQLRQALAEVKKLSGLLPICASCKRIRDDKGYWQQIEGYIRDHSEADFSHGICPECARRLYPDINPDED
jgi:two-component system, OmpR family, response regulator VanR